MDAKHTPTPWTFSAGYIRNADTRIVVCRSVFNDGQALADIDFIVRACNAHDDLVATLTYCLAWFEKEGGEDVAIIIDDKNRRMLDVARIRTAIAKATATT